MGTLTCRCGHWIKTDNEGTEGYSADFMPQKQWDQFDGGLLANIHSLAEAVKASKTPAEWANVTLSYKPGEEALLLYYFFQESYLDLGRTMYQCSKCSRLFVETSTRNEFRTFLPDDPATSKDMFEPSE